MTGLKLRRRLPRLVGAGVAVTVGLFVMFLVLAQTGLLPVTAGDFDERELRVTDCTGVEKGRLTVGVAETFGQRYVGLSRTASIGSHEGLLFPYDEEASHRIEMRNMNFGLDIVYVGADGAITAIKTLDAPDSTLEYYLLYDSTFDTGKYVIEVRSGWSVEHDVSTGDCVLALP